MTARPWFSALATPLVALLTLATATPRVVAAPVLRSAQAQAVAVPDTLDGRSYGFLQGSRATIRFSPPDSLVAGEVLRFLDGQPPLPGLPDSVPGGVTAWLAHSATAFDELTGGTVPEWRAGVAIPAERVLVLPTGEGVRPLSPAGRTTLRHEWAHIGLSVAIGGLRSPRWFTEGYAQWASVGFDATEAWKLRIGMALGRTPPIDSLTLRWPTDRARADIAYILSASAVTYLLERSGERGLEVLVDRWRVEGSFENAFRRTFGLTTSQFEEDWRKHVKSRYGWLFVLSHSVVFWGMLALVLLVFVGVRRGREREHMARLRAGEPPDRPAYWDGEPTGAEGPIDGAPGVEREP